jgi:hypothetical protein
MVSNREKPDTLEMKLIKLLALDEIENKQCVLG